MPTTLDALILPGWMERDEAVNLFGQCYFDPPLADGQAEATWKQYRDRVQALPARNVQPAKRHPIPARDSHLVQQFLQKFRIPGTDVSDVININPMECVIYQNFVVTDRADEHKRQNGPWSRKTLVLDRPTAQLPMRLEQGTIKFTLPHAEHMFAFSNGWFQIQQFAGFVSVTDIGGGKLLLKAGYHRSFAFARGAMNEPDAKDKCVLVALTTTLPPQLAPTAPQHGLRTTVLGSCPPLFSDFFDSNLAMAVKLRKKRYEAHLRITAEDEP
ncbi:MAG TPA: hypothetical protein VGR93_01660 [Candidatus Acidoferrales bacterium]|nr:hypothetical protein [Candidatus Acidoferrales bacterium]